ncbi:aldehyde dehydrogenase family protein [Holophaga foetida]|uniref:aldehyde dehydrogenase family protein n=1 Tax=Holophaga foetida TaxID=35839 RepID=UPI0002473B72|nr:aldehyde dehydrogenase family protein [Holophaga foetida]
MAQTTETYPIWVAGQALETSRALEVLSPYSGQVVYRTFLGGEAEYERAIETAQAARHEMQALPVFKRFQILKQVSEAIEQNRERFATIMARESGKPVKVALAEADRAAQTFLIAAEEAKRLPGELMSLDWMASGANKEAIIKYFPIGIVAGISPFNFPLNLVAHKVAPAIAAGCPIILKPASKTPISALFLASLIAETDLPKGALSVIPMDRETGNGLVTDDRFALLSFTGSPDVGWEMKKHCGRKKVVLELGGNAGLILDQDADVERAAARAVAGAFGNTGQSCIHTQRILVHETLFEAFTTRFTALAAQLVTGDPEDPSVDLSAMIDEKNAKRIEAWIEEAKADGAKVLLGGERKGNLIPPTILTNTKPTMKVCALETFGPTVAVEPFSDFRQAIEAINNSPFGLQAGVFTHDIRKVRYAFEQLHVGGVTINEVPTFRAEHQPYGGVKDSGIGREGPKYAILDMLEPRVLLMDYNSPL